VCRQQAVDSGRIHESHGTAVCPARRDDPLSREYPNQVAAQSCSYTAWLGVPRRRRTGIEDGGCQASHRGACHGLGTAPVQAFGAEQLRAAAAAAAPGRAWAASGHGLAQAGHALRVNGAPGHVQGVYEKLSWAAIGWDCEAKTGARDGRSSATRRAFWHAEHARKEDSSRAIAGPTVSLIQY
jgi:hypothetical protein